LQLVRRFGGLLRRVDNDRPEIVELLWERGLPTLFRLYEQIALAA